MTVDTFKSQACTGLPARQKDAGVERVPPHSIDCHVVPFVCLQVLTAVRLAALVDLALLRAYNEQVLTLLVEVETTATSQPGQRCL